MKASEQTAVRNLVDFDSFDESRAITLRAAIHANLLNVKGRRPSLQVVQRWANHKRGCRPIGQIGPKIILPTVLIGKERFLMPEWVEAFQRERQAVIVDRAKRLMGGK